MYVVLHGERSRMADEIPFRLPSSFSERRREEGKGGKWGVGELFPCDFLRQIPTHVADLSFHWKVHGVTVQTFPLSSDL